MKWKVKPKYTPKVYDYRKRWQFVWRPILCQTWEYNLHQEVVDKYETKVWLTFIRISERLDNFRRWNSLCFCTLGQYIMKRFKVWRWLRTKNNVPDRG